MNECRPQPVCFGEINYSGLADKGGKFTLLLVLAALFVGFSEEGMFRVVVMTSLRRHGLTEGKVALWSSVIFGLVHIANLIGGDAKAFAQAIFVDSEDANIAGVLLSILVYLVCGAIVLIRRHKIEPETTTATTPPAPATV